MPNNTPGVPFNPFEDHLQPIGITREDLEEITRQMCKVGENDIFDVEYVNRKKKEVDLPYKIYNVEQETFYRFTDCIGKRVVIQRTVKSVSDELKSLHGYISNWNGKTNEMEVTFPATKFGDNPLIAIYPVEWLAEDMSVSRTQIKNTKCIYCQNPLEVGKESRIKGSGTQPFYICHDCHEKNYFRCLHCTKHCKTSNHPHKDLETNKRVCSHCFRMRYVTCQECNTVSYAGTVYGSRCAKCRHRRVEARAYTSRTFTKTLGIKRFWGTEIECFCPEDDRQNDKDGWEAACDGSINPTRDDLGVEYKSGIFQGNKGIDMLKDMCDTINPSHKVNGSCGLHVHVDCTDLTQDQMLNIASFIRIFDNIIYSLMPRSRSKNDYCQKFSVPIRIIKESKLAKMNKLHHFDNLGRYRGFNMSAYQEHGTIEFRYHSGTTSYQKIKNWILTCLLIIEKQKDNFWDERTRSLKPCRRNLTKFFRYLDMPPELQEYWIGRYIEFNGKVKRNKTGDKVPRTTTSHVSSGQRDSNRIYHALLDDIIEATGLEHLETCLTTLTTCQANGTLNSNQVNDLMRTLRIRQQEIRQTEPRRYL